MIDSMTVGDSDLRVPAIRISPPDPIGAAVVVHGYGGCKEEQVGLAWHIAQAGLVVDCIDLRGHGASTLLFDENALEDVEVAVKHAREFGKVVSIGHSLGGRLSLICSADFAIGISPPLDEAHGARTKELLNKLRGYRVRTDSPSKIFDLLSILPKWVNRDESRSMIIYGSRDVPEIVAACDRLRSSKSNVLRIEGAMHSDTYLLNATFVGIAKQLNKWFDDSH